MYYRCILGFYPFYISDNIVRDAAGLIVLNMPSHGIEARSYVGADRNYCCAACMYRPTFHVSCVSSSFLALVESAVNGSENVTEVS